MKISWRGGENNPSSKHPTRKPVAQRMLCCAEEREEEPLCLGAGMGFSARLRKEPFLLSTSGSCCVCSPWPSSGAFNNSKREVKASPLPGTHLVAGGTAGSEELGVVPAAVDPPVLLEVDEVDQGLVAEVAGEAGRVPEVVPQPRC